MSKIMRRNHLSRINAKLGGQKSSIRVGEIESLLNRQLAEGGLPSFTWPSIRS